MSSSNVETFARLSLHSIKNDDEYGFPPTSATSADDYSENISTSRSTGKLYVTLSSSLTGGSLPSFGTSSVSSTACLSCLADLLRMRMNSTARFTERQMVDMLLQLSPLMTTQLAKSIIDSLMFQNWLCLGKADLYQLQKNSVQASFAAPVGSSIRESGDEEEMSFLETKCQEPTGFFPHLSACYSPSCTDGCYSQFCPRLAGPKNTKRMSKSVHRSNLQEVSRTSSEDLWSTSVSPVLLVKVSELERKRQEIIYEIIKTEKEYVGDLKVIKKYFVDNLLRSDIIPKEKRVSFVSTVFGNVDDIYKKNEVLLNDLLERQRDNVVVDEVGDVFVEWSQNLEPYVKYGENQAISKLTLDQELENNMLFLKFCEANERLPECRKLPLQSFLSRITTRLGRYPILLETLLKKTDDESKRLHLSSSIENIKKSLAIINEKAGHSLNVVQLKQLKKLLYIKPGDKLSFDLDLENETRQLIREGQFKKNNSNSSNEDQELHVYLLDNCLLMTRKHYIDGRRRLQLKKCPIPLYLLDIDYDHGDDGNHTPHSPVNGSMTFQKLESTPSIGSQDSYASSMQTQHRLSRELTVKMIGNHGFSYTLIASFVQCKQWADDIVLAREELKRKMTIYEFIRIMGTPSDLATFPPFLIDNEITCTCFYDGRLLLGTETGVYFGLPNQPETFRRLMSSKNIMQLQIVEAFDTVFVLSDGDLLYFSLESLKSSLNAGSSLTGMKMAGAVSFFRVGEVNGTLYLITVKSRILSTYIKIYKHVTDQGKVKRRDSVMKRISRGLSLKGAKTDFQKWKEIYIPSESLSLHVLRTKICVGCQRGFELVDIESLETQALVDYSDQSLKFLDKIEFIHPVGLFRASTDEFLLCFQEFGIYVDKAGKNSRPSQTLPHIEWTGKPKRFHMDGNYLIAVNENLVEIRDVVTSKLLQVIRGHETNLTFAEESIIHISTSQYIEMKQPAMHMKKSTSKRKLHHAISDSLMHPTQSLESVHNHLSRRQAFLLCTMVRRDNGDVNVFKDLPNPPPGKSEDLDFDRFTPSSRLRAREPGFDSTDMLANESGEVKEEEEDDNDDETEEYKSSSIEERLHSA